METQVLQGLLQYGLPTAACVVLWLAMNQRQDKADAAAVSRENAALEREARLGNRIDQLEDYIRENLAGLTVQSVEAIRASDSAIREFTAIARQRPCILGLQGRTPKIIEDARASGDLPV